MTYCLLNKKTGNLFEAKKVWFNEAVEDLVAGLAIIAPGEHDGWIIFHPNEAWGGHWLFFNRKCEDFFEVLGEV